MSQRCMPACPDKPIADLEFAVLVKGGAVLLTVCFQPGPERLFQPAMAAPLGRLDCGAESLPWSARSHRAAHIHSIVRF